MNKKVLLAVVIIALSFGLLSVYAADDKSEKVSMLQKIKNAYNDFKSRQQQKSQAAVNNRGAGQVSAPKANAPEAKIEKKELSREEMLAQLNEDFGVNEEVFDAVPGLKAEKTADGKASYTFNGKKLSDLSKEDLKDLFIKARQALVRIRTDRIQRQLDTVKRVDSVNRLANPPMPSRVPAAGPSIPKVPTTPPSVTKAPSLPPSPPKR